MKKYKITYHNGISQVKNLISHDDFLNDIKPTYDLIYELEVEKKMKDVFYHKKRLTNTYGHEWFTDKSPLFFAIQSGILELPSTQGGKSKCIVEFISE